MAGGDGGDGLAREVADRRENHPVGGVRSLNERPDSGPVVPCDRGFAAQDIVPQFRSGEEQVLERVVDQVGGRILVGVDFVRDHLALFLQLAVGEGRAESDVGDQLRCLGKVAPQRGRVDRGLLFGGEGIELAAQVFEPAIDLPRLASGRALEKGVLGEVGQSVFRGALVAAARPDDQGAVRDVAFHLPVDSPDAVGQGVGFKFHVVIGKAGRGSVPYSFGGSGSARRALPRIPGCLPRCRLRARGRSPSRPT